MTVAEGRQVVVDDVHYFGGDEVTVSPATAEAWQRYGWAQPAKAESTPDSKPKARVRAGTNASHRLAEGATDGRLS